MTEASKGKTLNGPAENTKLFAPEERWRLIAETAYYRAVRRGFQNGDPVDDWLTAEREVNTLLSQPTGAVKAARKAEVVARPAKTPKTGDAGTDACR